ncbi:MAG: 23S rRNA (pseudouridine(1915)-N(3))-methyltransferase RlmH [Miniphocaeibacter sp.]|uniref:23S rRNA (pseudouridine(1915)-N(3))-methyltransferase RlmH n=1 Tax=Miniphocaeibacter sp. TaxID=3100973 RepID=UPI00178E9310|nr:23S rRNA (pseudouridine(1915)-N(3))-methyltransferase RlmH [Gallicola sp.]
MNIKIIAVGNIKEKYLKNGISEYLKRIQKYAKIQIIEIPEVKVNENSQKIIEKALQEEGEKIKNKIKDKDFVITLEIEGKNLTSTEFSKKIDLEKSKGYNSFTFIIGSSHGLSSEIKSLSNMKLSFSKMTFPHQLMRLILLEQIYRSFKIANNEPYHK